MHAAVGGDVADQRAEPDPDGEQVEHRLDEAAEQQQPGPAEGGHVALHDVARQAEARGERQRARGPHGGLHGAHETSLRVNERRASTQPTPT